MITIRKFKILIAITTKIKNIRKVNQIQRTRILSISRIFQKMNSMHYIISLFFNKETINTEKKIKNK